MLRLAWKRRWLQFSLRTLLLVVLVASLGLASSFPASSVFSVPPW